MIKPQGLRCVTRGNRAGVLATAYIARAMTMPIRPMHRPGLSHTWAVGDSRGQPEPGMNSLLGSYRLLSICPKLLLPFGLSLSKACLYAALRQAQGERGGGGRRYEIGGQSGQTGCKSLRNNTLMLSFLNINRCTDRTRGATRTRSALAWLPLAPG